MAENKAVEQEQMELEMGLENEGVQEVALQDEGLPALPDQLVGPDGEELLFEGGPAISKVEEWKSQFGDEVYLTEFETETFLWRPITRKEYKQVMKIQGADSYYKEERICDTVVLFPEQYNFMAMTNGKAGIPTLLSELVMEKSGFQAKTGAMKI